MRAKELKRRLSSQSQVFSGLDKSKADKLTLEPIPGCFHSLDESHRCSTYLGLFSQPDESKRAENTPELANSQIKSERAKKMLELTLSQVFSGLDESKKVEKPTIDLSWVVLMA
jgi:hypothetical protein